MNGGAKIRAILSPSRNFGRLWRGSIWAGIPSTVGVGFRNAILPGKSLTLESTQRVLIAIDIQSVTLARIWCEMANKRVICSPASFGASALRFLWKFTAPGVPAQTLSQQSLGW